MPYKKITPEKRHSLEEAAIAILSGKASLFVRPTKRHIEMERKMAAVERDLVETDLSQTKIARRNRVDQETVKKVLEGIPGLAAVRNSRVGALSQPKKRSTGVFSEEEVEQVIRRVMPFLNGMLARFFRQNYWLLKNGYYSEGEILEFVLKALRHKLLTLDKKYSKVKSDHIEIAKLVNNAVSKFILPEFLRKACRKYANHNHPRQIPESQFYKGEGSMADNIAWKPESSRHITVAGVRKRLGQKGIPPVAQVLLLARLAGMNAAMIGGILGVSESRIAQLLGREKPKLGIKVFAPIRPKPGFIAKRKPRKPI